MFGSVGPTEIILIFIIALLVFGPKKLPEIGKSVGKAIREFKKASDEIKGRIEDEINASEIKDVGKDLQSGVNTLREGIRGIADSTGITDLKNEFRGAAQAPAAPSPYDAVEKPPAPEEGPAKNPQAVSQEPQKNADENENREGQKISG
jgi:TatA/E family protein of Tat protein translocase